jgi:hypothetical protein
MRALTASRLVIAALVLVHLWINVRHGAAHDTLSVGLPTWKWIYVYVVILGLPLVGAAALWSRWLVQALWLVAMASAGALVFGVYHHYVLISPDNVAHLPPGPADAHQAFTSTAALLALLEFLTTGAALFLCGYWTGSDPSRSGDRSYGVGGRRENAVSSG